MTNQPAFSRADPDERRQSLIEACARVLAEKGAAGVSVRAICTEAGVSPGLLRHYFSGISEAIAATYRWTGARFDSACSTSWIIRATEESAAVLVTRIVSGPAPFKVPA